MPLQVPAGFVSGMGKQGVDAGSRLRRIEDELGLATFLRDRVVGEDRYLSEGLTVSRHPRVENKIVHAVGKYDEA